MFCQVMKLYPNPSVNEVSLGRGELRKTFDGGQELSKA
jgi:hypothetical protein